MTRRSVEGVLRGRRVLLVHEDAFFAGYLCDVIAASGATVIGAVPMAVQGLALLDHDLPPCVLVLSTMVRDDEAIARRAAARGVATLFVQPARNTSPPVTARQAVLTAPFAGFQVVDALRQLLSAAPADPESCGHPRMRGH